MNETTRHSEFTDTSLEQIKTVLAQTRRLLMTYEFGMQSVMTRVNILRDEFRLAHSYNPIEHVSSRIKSLQSLRKKMSRKGLPILPETLRENIFDIAGIRLTCSFVSDIYRMRKLLIQQPDLKLLEERDYIANPKPNGYKSLHLIVEVPVYLTDRVEHIPVEIQLRTIAMDFWASLEHKIYYKYEKDVPRHLTDALKLAADVASSLDTSMERIHEEIHQLELADRQLSSGEDNSPATPFNFDGTYLGDGAEAESFLRAIMESIQESEEYNSHHSE